MDSKVLCLSQLACGDGFATWDFAQKNDGGKMLGGNDPRPIGERIIFLKSLCFDEVS